MPQPMTGPMRDIMVIWEFRGDYPEVPYAPGVNIEELIQGDPDPVFVTLPIGQAGVTSGNQRHYDEAFVRELERQTITNRPVGIMGHLRPQDLASAFPSEAVHWVGAKRVGELLWGKGYVPPGEPRDRLRRYKAAGTRIATSIFAEAQGAWDETLKAFRMVGNTLKLGQIDIAPADRAGIASLAAVPLLTSEMTDTPDTEPGEEQPPMDKYQVIREMTAEDAKLLPDPVVQAIQAKVPQPETPAEVGMVAELRQALGVDDKTDLKTVVTELRQAQDHRARERVTARIQELVTATEGGIALEALRPLVMELVQAKAPQTETEAETAYKQVVESEHVKRLLAAQVREMAGPNQQAPVTPGNGQPRPNRYFQIPARESA